MCHPQVSSSIESEYRLHQTLYEPFIGKPPLLDSPWHTDSQFEQLIHSLDTVDTLIVTGGEPLINPKVIKLIQSLHPQKLNLIVTTNGTQIKPDVYKLLQNLRSCSITVSLEGVGAHNEYLRYGSHWIEQEKNIKWLSQLPNARWIPMLINHTLQMTSCWSLPALIDWCVENNYDFSINRLTWPTYLSLECMTDFQREKLINDLAQRIMSVRQTFGDGNTLSWLKGTIECLENVKHDAQRADQFRRYVKMLDTIRGTSFDDVFPSFGHQPTDGY
jgi:hypothetical protein